MRILIIISFFLSAFDTLAQSTGRLTLHGKVKYRNIIVKEVDIEIRKDNEIVKQFKNLRNGAYKLELDLGHVYNIAFSKNGYIEKSVAVVAKADSVTRINGRYFFQLDIELFKLSEAGQDESMIPPVAKLYIKNQQTGFTYDKKYVKWVAGHYDD